MSARCDDVRPELPALLAGELTPDDEAGVRAHLAECPACRRDVDELRATIALLRGAPLQHEASPDLEGRVFELAALEHVGSLVSAAPLETEPPIDLEARALVRAGVLDSFAPRTRWAKASMVLAPSLAAAAIVFGFLASEWHSRINQLEDLFGPMGHQVASQELTSFDATNSARADLFDSSHTNYHLVLHAEHLPLTPAGYHYELWLSGDEGTISAGSFRVRGPEDTVFPFTVAVNPQKYPHLEISLEPDDGDPDHTGETIMEADFNLQ